MGDGGDWGTDLDSFAGEEADSADGVGGDEVFENGGGEESAADEFGGCDPFDFEVFDFGGVGVGDGEAIDERGRVWRVWGEQ